MNVGLPAKLKQAFPQPAPIRRAVHRGKNSRIRRLNADFEVEPSLRYLPEEAQHTIIQEAPFDLEMAGRAVSV